MSTTYEVQFKDAGPGNVWQRYIGDIDLWEARRIVADEKRADASYSKESGAVVTTKYRIVKVVTTVVRKAVK